MHGRGRRLKDPNVHTRNVLTWFLMGLGRHCDPVSTRAVSFLEEGGPDAVVSVHADTFTIAFAALLSEMCETHIELHPFLVGDLFGTRRAIALLVAIRCALPSYGPS